MDNIADFMGFVNEQIAFHQNKAAVFSKGSAKYPPNSYRSEAHQKMAQRFAEQAAYIIDLHNQLQAKQHSIGKSIISSKLGLTPEEIDGLPPELLEELSITEADKADFAVIAVIDEAGGVLSLDKILIALYRKTGEVNKRANLNSRVYRLVNKGSLFNVPGRKGVYSTQELTEEDAAKLS